MSYSSILHNASLLKTGRLFPARIRPVGQFSIRRTASSGGGSSDGSGQIFKRIAMVGAGKMAQAFMEPMISKGVQPANKFYVYDVSLQAMMDSQNRLGVQTTDSLSDVINDADLVILAVKPQNLTTAFFDEIKKGRPSDNAIVLSIIAGKPMTEFLNTGMTKIVRSMPNT
jgi:pyrroline-5-carboxylate reductase